MQDPIVNWLGAWAGTLSLPAVLLRLCLALCMGALIGCERSAKRHSAGLRTFLLTALAGAVAAMTDTALSYPVPLLSAIVIFGAALISGKSILFSARSQIRGLTTAAALWVCTLLGITAGAGLLTLSLLLFLLLLLILSGLPPLEKWLKRRSDHFEIHLELGSRTDLQNFSATVRRLGLRIDDIESNPAYLGSGLSVYTVGLTVRGDAVSAKNHGDVIEALRCLDYIRYIEEI